MLSRVLGVLRRPPADAAGRLWGRRPAPSQATPAPMEEPGQARAYAGPVQVRYAPERDGDPDPGEVVWTWVPYLEDPRQGKDRPVLVVGSPVGGPPGELAVVALSSQDHDGDAQWLELGAGPWDREGRVSEVRLDRVYAVAADAVRREGGVLDRGRFDRVVTALRHLHGWH